MVAKLSTTISKIQSLPNSSNGKIINEFLIYMRENGSSERHQNNNLTVLIEFSNHFDSSVTFYNINKKEQILSFLDIKIKDIEKDPEKRWITSWNYYLVRIKLFYRWLYNKDKEIERDYWETPGFLKIKNKKTKRISPYVESEIWEKDELISILKYEPYKRNKAAITLMWDLNARPHEITLLKIKHIRLREKYGEGEIPYEAKTGSGPILLTLSFAYVRDWLNEHPFKNEPNARLIGSLINGSPIRSDSLWTMMKQLRIRIKRLLQNGSITNIGEREKMVFLLKTKKFNPYCLRHSAITSDSDYLPEYALKKKVRWSMNSKQGTRYIKNRLGNDLKEKILQYNGIISENVSKKKPSIVDCPRCDLLNAIENKYCSKCSYPLKHEAYDEIKSAEDKRMKILEENQKQKDEQLEIIQSQMNVLVEIITKLDSEEGKNKIAKQLIENGLFTK
jgi:integrase/recombinase XerD